MMDSFGLDISSLTDRMNRGYSLNAIENAIFLPVIMNITFLSFSGTLVICFLATHHKPLVNE